MNNKHWAIIVALIIVGGFICYFTMPSVVERSMLKNKNFNEQYADTLQKYQNKKSDKKYDSLEKQVKFLQSNLKMMQKHDSAKFHVYDRKIASLASSPQKKRGTVKKLHYQKHVQSSKNKVAGNNPKKQKFNCQKQLTDLTNLIYKMNDAANAQFQAINRRLDSAHVPKNQ